MSETRSVEVVRREYRDTDDAWAFTARDGSLWYDCEISKAVYRSLFEAEQEAKRFGGRAISAAKP